MSPSYEITTCLKSRHFEKAATLLKAHQTFIDGRTTFKLMRYLVTQLKINSSNIEDEDSVKEFMQDCCATLDQSQDLTADDAEFTQGLVSLYHLVTLSLTSSYKSEISLLTKTILVCLRKTDKSLNDVQSIAANVFLQVWKIANKENSELCFSYRSVALLILVHGGSTHWNRLIEKLIIVVQEPSNPSFQLAESIFDELLSYCNNHKLKESYCVSSLLQVWTCLVLSSNSSNQHQDRTSKLKLFAMEIQEHCQVFSIIDLVLNLFGDSDDASDEVGFSLPKWNNFFAKDFEIVFVRITMLSLSSSCVVRSQSAETKWNRTNQIISTLNVLLYFCQESDRLGEVVKANLQMEPINLRITCLTRAFSVALHLVKLDFSKIFVCQRVIHQIDKLFKQGIVEQSKSSGNCLSNAENFANNIAVISNQNSDHVNAVKYYRKALEYHIINVSELLLSSGELPTYFSMRLMALYDTRKAARDWDGIIEDFALCFSKFYDYCEANIRIRCKSQAIEQQLLVAWSRFKRDVHQCSTPSCERFLKMTVLDVFKQINVTFDNDSAWRLLFEEYRMLDRRIGPMPKAAFSLVAQQASTLAKSSFQKGVSSFFLSRKGDDFVQRHKAAKKAIAKLSGQTTMADCKSQGQVYIALAYLELYVSQQEMLKKKTEEEMESLGPLIQSSSNVEVQSGEDGTNLQSDGTSVDAVSYSYLKLELELKNQEWMVKCLQQWEELVQFGWSPDQYSNIIFTCLKSLGYYFSLIGNSFFSARAWSLSLKLAESVNSNEELVLSASELLRLGWKVENCVLLRCKELIEKKELVIQEQLFFHLSMAWSQYLQHNFAEAWQILDEQVLQSSSINTESPSKSILLLISQANLLRSLLAVLPEELSHIPPSDDIGPVQAGVKAAQSAYTTLRWYVGYAQQYGWDYYGQEWNILGNFLVAAINIARIYLYIAAPREARFFLKEALNAAQKHVSVLRTAEALLVLCNLDLMLDNTIDCQSKLVLICHLMGVAPPVIPDSENIAPSAGKKSFETPASPVQLKTDRRKGIATRNVPEIQIQVQQDATQRALQLPLNHQGASPNTKAREVSDGIFPQHISDCICLICSGELTMSIRIAALSVQSKLWSLLGFQDLATEDFLKGRQLVQSICSRLRSSTKPVAAKNSSKRLFEVPDCLKINETWVQYKMHWFQPAVVTGMELFLENAMHRLVTESTTVTLSELLDPVKAVMYDFYLGPLEHRVMKLTSAIATISLQQPTCFTTPEQKCKIMVEEEDDDIIILEGGLAPKTPGFGLRKPLEIPAPRRVRRNLMAVKVDDTITIDDDEDSDGGFSRRRLGKPQKAILYSSDSDSDLLPPTPPTVKAPKKTRAVVKKKTQDMPSPTAEFTIPPVEKTYSKRRNLKSSDSKSEDLDIRPEKEKRSAADKTKPPGKTASSSKAKAEADLDPQQSAASAPVEKKFFKSRLASSSSKKDLEVADLSSKLAATKINPENTETKETRPKRTTRSTRK